MGLLQSVLCDIDFNDSESYRGTSYLPFLGFMVFFAGMMIAFIGIVKISNSRHQWNIFYDERDRKQRPQNRNYHAGCGNCDDDCFLLDPIKKHRPG